MTARTRWAVLSTCLLACALALAGPAGATPTSALRFRHLSEPGNPSVLAMLQDRQGFVWIGTQNGGLYRYDGYQALQYRHDERDPGSLPDNRVQALYQDRAGILWIGTRKGLARYHPEHDAFSSHTPGRGAPGRLDVKAIVADGGQGLWIASWGGIQHYDPASGRFIQHAHRDGDPASLAHNDVNALALDQRGGLWAATWPGGLDYLAPGAAAFQHFRLDHAGAPNAKLNNARALCFDRQQTLWIGTETGVLAWRDGSDWSTRRRVAAPPVRINQFFPGAGDTMWAGTISAGLLRWDGGRATPQRYVYRANDPYSLPADNIRAVLLDRGGMLWAGSFTDGIGVANLGSTGLARIIPYDIESGEPRPNNLLRSMAGAPGGRLWLGGTSGLSLYDPASGTVLQTYGPDPERADALQSGLVFSLYQQPGGPLWVGTAAGLHRLDPGASRFQAIQLGGGANDFINAIVPGTGAWLWLGTGKGVIHYNHHSGAYRLHAHQPGQAASLSVTGATTLLEDRAGRLWAGSEAHGGGLDLLDPDSGAVRHFRHQPGQPASLADDTVTALFEDGAGRLWVGTDHGLNQLRMAADGSVRFLSYAAPDSVGDVSVLALRDDAAGQLWVNTAAGLLRLDPASGRASRYFGEDGAGDAFTVGTAHAAPDGTLYFGAARGLTAVQPAAVRVQSSAPQVAITDVRVDNQSLRRGADSDAVRLSGAVTAPRALTLALPAAVLQIEFAALHYTAPLKNRYAYRLQGFDRDWVQTDAAHRSATYTALAPGRYTFEVKAANHLGTWSGQAASMQVTIRPAFWQTWWFRLAAAAALTGLLAGAYRLRVQQLRRQRRALAQLVALRTAELEASNSKLAALSTTDGLTGVSNRRGFDEALQREWGRARREGTPLALALLDVDWFKRYNDHFGHPAGDSCLQQVAEALAASARRPTDLVSRYGGEEFALLAPATDAVQALALAQAACRRLAGLGLPHPMSAHGVVTVSIGVAVLAPDDSTAPALLIRLADEALYCAKHSGRNQARLHAGPTEQQLA